MDSILESQSTAECIKRTTLMHQDSFKHQVPELHQIYNVQKLLIHELQNRSKHTKELTASSINPFEGVTKMKIAEDQETEAVEVELTLGIGQCKRDRKMSRDNVHLCNTLHDDHFDQSSQGIESTSNMSSSSYQDITRKIGYIARFKME